MQDFVQDSVAKEYINGILAKGMAHILNQAYDNLRSANTRLQSLQQERDNNLLASVKDPAADKLYEELVQIRATLAQKEDALESLKLENGQMRENQEAYRQKIDELNNQIDLLKQQLDDFKRTPRMAPNPRRTSTTPTLSTSSFPRAKKPATLRGRSPSSSEKT